MSRRRFQTRALTLSVVVFAALIGVDFWFEGEASAPWMWKTKTSRPPYATPTISPAKPTEAKPHPVEFWGECLSSQNCPEPESEESEWEGVFFDESLIPARQQLSLALRDWKREKCSGQKGSSRKLAVSSARILEVANATGQREFLEGLNCDRDPEAGGPELVEAFSLIAPENLELFVDRVIHSGTESKRRLLDAIRTSDRTKPEASRDQTIARIRVLAKVRPDERDLPDWLGPICRDAAEPEHWRREVRAEIQGLLEKLGSSQAVDTFCPKT